MAFPWPKSAAVQAALISGTIAGFVSVITVVLAVWLPSHMDAPRLRDENVRLQNANNTLEAEIGPFKTVAIQNFTGTETERLSKLALKLNEFQKNLEALSANQTTIESRTNDLTSQLAPRHLTDTQQARFIAYLKSIPKGPVGVVYISSVPETVSFVEEIISLLKNSGFILPEKPEYSLGYTVSCPAPWRIAIIVGTGPQASYALPLQRAFVEIGIDATGTDGKDIVKPGEIKVYVGSK